MKGEISADVGKKKKEQTGICDLKLSQRNCGGTPFPTLQSLLCSKHLPCRHPRLGRDRGVYLRRRVSGDVVCMNYFHLLKREAGERGETFCNVRFP